MACRTARAAAVLASAVVVLAIMVQVTAAPAGAAPVDTTAPSVPGTPVATQITETSALLTWRPSVDDTAVTQYEIWYLRDGGNGFYNNTSVPSFRFSALTPNTSYTWMVRASDGRNQSGFSASVTFRTDPAPQETEPPSAPGAPGATQVAATTATLAWAPSTDNASEPNYLVYAGAEGVGNTTVVGGGSEPATRVNQLIPDLRYDFHVVARDVSGNVSPRSPTTRVRTAVDPTASCRATYQPEPGGGTAIVRVTNTGPAPLSGWSVRFAFTGDQRILFATYAAAQTGRDVVAWWSGWSDVFSVGETLDLRLYLASPVPATSAATGFILNGAPCAAP